MPNYQYPFSAFATGVLDDASFRAELVAMLNRDPSSASTAVDQLTTLHTKHNLSDNTFTYLRRFAETVAAKQAFGNPLTSNENDDYDRTVITQIKTPRATQSRLPENRVQREYAGRDSDSFIADDLSDAEVEQEELSETIITHTTTADNEGGDDDSVDATLISTADTHIEQTTTNYHTTAQHHSKGDSTYPPDEANQVTEIRSPSPSRGNQIGSAISAIQNTSADTLRGGENSQVTEINIGQPDSLSQRDTNFDDDEPSKFNMRNILGGVALTAIMSVVYFISPGDVETVGVAPPITYTSMQDSKAEKQSAPLNPTNGPSDNTTESATSPTKESLEERLLRFSKRTQHLTDKPQSSQTSLRENPNTPSKVALAATNRTSTSPLTPTSPTSHYTSSSLLTLPQLHQRAVDRAIALQLEPSSDPDSATGYLKLMIKKDKSSPLIREARAEIARAYLTLAKQERKKGNWERVDELVEKAITVRMKNSVIN